MRFIGNKIILSIFEKSIFLWIGGGLLLVGMGALVFWRHSPYQAIESQVKKSLLAKGIELNDLTIEKITTNKAQIANISMGGNPPLTIDNLTVGYLLPEVVLGKIQTFDAKHVSITLYSDQGQWNIGGFKMPSLTSSIPKESFSMSQLFHSATLQQLIPKAITAQESKFHVKSEGIMVEAPFDLFYTLEPEGNLSIASKHATLKTKSTTIKVNEINVLAKLDEEKEQWRAAVTIPNLSIPALPEEYAPLAVAASVAVSPANLHADIMVRSQQDKVQADITLSAPLTKFSQGNLFLRKAKIPWGGGVISVASVSIPVLWDKPIALPVHLQNIELSALLSKISGGKIEGTGRVSGILPILYYQDGHIELQKGEAQAKEHGIISVPPNLLPGDNAQLALARTVLENFHYTSLKIIVSSDASRPAVMLALEGSNPEALEGKSVHLNVTLAGDIMPLIEQSIIPFNHLKQLLKETP